MVLRLVYRTPGHGLTNRSLVAAAGAFAMTGTAMSPRRQRKVAAATGSFLETGTAASPTSSGGYNNILNWPSTANRPTLSGSTLSWTGPVGGGPSTASDPAQSRVLSSSGGFSTTSNGQVIEGIDITGTVNIGHNNVTIRQCAIRVSSSGGRAVNITKASCTGLVIEDCYIYGAKNTLGGIVTNSGSSFVSTTPSFIRRNNLNGFENHITLWCPGNFNMSVIDNYFTAAGNAGNSSYDGDMIEFYECTNVTCEHNVFDGTGSQTSNIILNSFVNLSNLGALDVDVNNNLFANCSFVNVFCVCDDNGFGGAFVWSFTNNGFYNRLGKDFRRGDTTAPSPNTGNYTAATITATSGTLVNSGTGAI